MLDMLFQGRTVKVYVMVKVYGMMLLIRSRAFISCSKCASEGLAKTGRKVVVIS